MPSNRYAKVYAVGQKMILDDFFNRRCYFFSVLAVLSAYMHAMNIYASRHECKIITRQSR